MTTDVYADILFLINAGMDCLCHLLTARLLRRRLIGWRLILASVAGGAYAVAALFLPFGQIAALATDLLVCALLCALVFPPEKSDHGRRWGGLLPVTGAYLLISLALGGIMTGLYSLLNRSGCPEALQDAGEDLPTAWLFALLAVIGGGISLWGGRLFRRSGSRQIVEVTVFLGERSVTLTGLVDSGNLLTDPLDGHPVVPVSRTAVACLLSQKLDSCLRAGSLSPERLAATPEASRLRMIPVSTATGEAVWLGLRPDRMIIRSSEGSRVLEVRALIAPQDLDLDGGADTPTPQALVPATLI